MNILTLSLFLIIFGLNSNLKQPVRALTLQSWQEDCLRRSERRNSVDVMRSVKIIKQGKNEALATLESSEGEITNRRSTREITTTVKGWVADFHRRRRDEELASFEFRKLRLPFLVVILSLFGLGTESQGQQLRDAFRKVEGAVVVLRTNQKELAPFPQQGMVSLNGLGSGVLISNDGKVMTAAHLVQSADQTVVEFSDGETIPARVTGSAFSADVALLQLERLPTNMLPATLGNSDHVEVGDQIFVVGAPYGISRTLTAGHVSGRRALNKRVQSAAAVEFLQTDAAINTGSSGSPVFNLDGEVVGIISNILSRSGGSEGVAFAATSNTARRLLLDRKPFWSGIEGFLVDGDLAQALNLPQPAGWLVQRVAEGSIAWRWGIHPGRLRASVEGQDLVLGGDIILAMNEVPIENEDSYDRIYASVTKLSPADNLTVKIFRDGQIVKLSVPLNP